MRTLKTEADYKQAVADAESKYGPDSILTSYALVGLSRFYGRCGLLDAANDCRERIHGILEKYMSGLGAELETF